MNCSTTIQSRTSPEADADGEATRPAQPVSRQERPSLRRRRSSLKALQHVGQSYEALDTTAKDRAKRVIKALKGYNEDWEETTTPAAHAGSLRALMKQAATKRPGFMVRDDPPSAEPAKDDEAKAAVASSGKPPVGGLAHRSPSQRTMRADDHETRGPFRRRGSVRKDDMGPVAESVAESDGLGALVEKSAKAETDSARTRPNVPRSMSIRKQKSTLRQPGRPTAAGGVSEECARRAERPTQLPRLRFFTPTTTRS